ncbi:polysaccharide deacetylase family protein [Brevibacillus centrosporus]|uniref:polysaccharide deacetylase n=1 Tax=Brevibacillus centrosporus TaxID=54910 RepID=UPI002E2119FC|nr:polysaccharide deacetylase family protein [Brevibacillus centrosporus]
MRRKRESALDYHQKNRRKVKRTIVQFVILLAVGILLYQAVFDTKSYAEADHRTWQNDKGFIAISYFGVGRSGTPKLIAKAHLDEQLQALRNQGYVTISQQDILDFYNEKKPLPEKALFLSFEDGRNDSHLFAQPLLEKYNFKATALSYANKMGNSDNKFLQPKDLLNMQEGGFWELGTNGYRLTYINIFDRQGNFIGVRDENELPTKHHVEYYNHYLMDFIRDSNMIPIEDRSMMEARITQDYDQMREIYTDTLGFVPKVYMIMHANTLYGGMNRLVSDVNDANIRKTFAMHFNREGTAYNSNKDSLYDLTRLQPDPYWYTNHLLMKIQSDTQQKMKFVHGDEQLAQQWRLESGAEEFKGNKIVLTSPPAEEGSLFLDNSSGSQDLRISAKLEGNVVGKQSIYLRDDREKGSFVRVTLHDNTLIVEQKKAGQEPVGLYSTKLSEVLWQPEDLAYDKATVYTKSQTEAGAPDEDEGYPVNIQNTRQMDIVIQGDKLSVSVDNALKVNQQAIDSAIASGGVALGSAYSEKNKQDDIYDGVFTDVKISSIQNGASDQEQILFRNSYTGMEKAVNRMKDAFTTTVDWVMETF